MDRRCGLVNRNVTFAGGPFVCYNAFKISPDLCILLF